MDRKTIFLAFALAASSSANVYLLLKSARLVSGRRTARAASSSVVPASQADCFAELRHCRDATLARAIGLAVPSAPGLDPRTIDAGSARQDAAPDVDVDHDTIDALLCDMARRHVDEEWRRQRDEITQSLRTSLADFEEQRRNEALEVGRAASWLGLSDDQRTSFEAEYVQLRRARVAQARAALVLTPPDHRAVCDAGRALFAEEDALVARLFGPEKRASYRRLETEGRTVVLALCASLGGVPWEDAVVW